MDKRNKANHSKSAWPFMTKGPGKADLIKVFEDEYNRLCDLAVKIDKLQMDEKLKTLDSLEAWERLQVLDEIRRFH